MHAATVPFIIDPGFSWPDERDEQMTGLSNVVM
jgi:hypothetical protein